MEIKEITKEDELIMDWILGSLGWPILSKVIFRIAV